MFGSRPDGRRIRGIDPIMQITPYAMPMRCDAQVFTKYRADLEVLQSYIRRQRLEAGETFSYMHIILAAYVRAVSRNPQVNRFIMNKQLFARNNCSCAFTILKDPNDIDRGEAVVKIRFDLTDTIYDVRDRVDAAIAANRGDQPPGFVEKLFRVIFAVPGLATVVVGLVGLLDRYGLAPGVLMDELPFYVGLYLTNMASLRVQEVNHHLYNWGNVGMFASLGLDERQTVVENGQTRTKRYLPMGITLDERVCSGAHYTRFFRDYRHYMAHPELLEYPPEAVCFDQGLEYHEPKPGEAQDRK